MPGYGHGQYKKTQVATVDSGRLIILLYEGAISFLHKCKGCMADRDYPGLALNFNRALDIIDELDASLNLSEGGEIAGNLRRLYRFMSHHLLKARSSENVAMVEEVIRLLVQLNESWKEALGTQEAQEVLARKQTPAKATTKSLVA